jgi:hypothetical protein
MKLPLFLLIPLAATALAAAVPKETVLFKGKYYREARVDSVNLDGTAEIRSKDGSATVAIASLPGSLRAYATAEYEKKLKKKAVEAAREEKAAAFREANKGTVQTVVRIVNILPQGILCMHDDGRKILIQGHPNQAGLADGEKISFRGTPEGVFKYKTTLGTEATARIYTYVAAK